MEHCEVVEVVFQDSEFDEATALVEACLGPKPGLSDAIQSLFNGQPAG